METPSLLPRHRSLIDRTSSGPRVRQARYEIELGGLFAQSSVFSNLPPRIAVLLWPSTACVSNRPPHRGRIPKLCKSRHRGSLPAQLAVTQQNAYDPGNCCASMASMVDSYRFLDSVAKRVMQHWSGLRAAKPSPWTPLAKPLPPCTIALVSA